MPFERPTLEEIKDRIEKGIESRLFGKTALLRYAVLRVLARVFAGAIHTCYGYILTVVKQLFVTTATKKWLDRHGKMWGVLRKAGSFASGQGFFSLSGVPLPADIPKNTIVQDENGIEFAVTQDTTVTTGSAWVPLQAVEAGATGNILAPTILQLVSSTLDGINDEINVQDDFTGGQDEETDEKYRNRILLRIQEPPMGGNAADYIKWALDVSGVDQAWSYPLAQGPGTVGVCITAEGNNPVPSAVLLSDVAAYIGDVKPVGATVYVESIEDLLGNDGYAQVMYYISITPFTQEVKNKIVKNIEDLFYPIKPGSEILISQVRAAITAAGATDYTITAFWIDTSVEDPDEDYELPGYCYPVLDQIVFQEKV